MKPRFRAEWEVSSEKLCILASWFLSPISKNSVLEELRDVLKSVLKVRNAWVRAEWAEKEEKLTIVCVKVVAEGKEIDKSAERGSVQHDEE